MQESILVWNEVNGLKVRVHGYDSSITIVMTLNFCNKRKIYVVNGTDPFENAIQSMIERDLKLTRGVYGLHYEHSLLEEGDYMWIETDLDWHNAVKYFNDEGTSMFLECSYLPAAYPH